MKRFFFFPLILLSALACTKKTAVVTTPAAVPSNAATARSVAPGQVRMLQRLPLAPPNMGNAALQSGPMLGYTDLREVLVWVQTNCPAEVVLEYWDSLAPATVYQTETIHTEKSTAFTAKCLADQVMPGRTYFYNIYLNGQALALPYPLKFRTQPLWRWRTDPPAFSVATGSCAYMNEPEFDRPGRGYGSDYHIFTSIYNKKPDVMLWLGDNVYYREPDWSTRTGMLHRFTHDRSIPELQPLLASANHYAIWDDHDFGPDNSDGTWPFKETAWEVFRAFWGNPTFGVNGQKGCTTYFEYADMDFFLLDNRYFRTPNDCETCPDRSMLGKEQLRWLLASLSESRAPFKIVATGGQVLNTMQAHETYSNYFPAERDSILKHIEREKIKGVVFLTGDRHFTELSKITNAAGIDVYDLTISPLTSGVFADADKKDTSSVRVPGTIVTRHNFGVLRFSGPRQSRRLDITVYDADGKELWTRTLEAVK